MWVPESVWYCEVVREGELDYKQDGRSSVSWLKTTSRIDLASGEGRLMSGELTEDQTEPASEMAL